VIWHRAAASRRGGQRDEAPLPANASPGDERHTRKSLMQYVANVINEQLHELDPERVRARRRAEAARRPAPTLTVTLPARRRA
jgi:hypothetical protein